MKSSGESGGCFGVREPHGWVVCVALHYIDSQKYIQARNNRNIL